MRELAADHSNWRAEGSLDALLADAGVPGLTGVDTRSLTRHLVAVLDAEAERCRRREQLRQLGRRLEAVRGKLGI